MVLAGFFGSQFSIIYFSIAPVRPKRPGGRVGVENSKFKIENSTSGIVIAVAAVTQ
jgi:hypothetical protein